MSEFEQVFGCYLCVLCKYCQLTMQCVTPDGLLWSDPVTTASPDTCVPWLADLVVLPCPLIYLSYDIICNAERDPILLFYDHE